MKPGAMAFPYWKRVMKKPKKAVKKTSTKAVPLSKKDLAKLRSLLKVRGSAALGKTLSLSRAALFCIVREKDPRPVHRSTKARIVARLRRIRGREQVSK